MSRKIFVSAPDLELLVLIMPVGLLFYSNINPVWMFILHTCELQIRLMLNCYLCKRGPKELRNGGNFLLIRQFGKQSVSLVQEKKMMCVHQMRPDS